MTFLYNALKMPIIFSEQNFFNLKPTNLIGIIFVLIKNREQYV